MPFSGVPLFIARDKVLLADLNRTTCLHLSQPLYLRKR
jgi:hypothetical protein